MTKQKLLLFSLSVVTLSIFLVYRKRLHLCPGNGWHSFCIRTGIILVQSFSARDTFARTDCLFGKDW